VYEIDQFSRLRDSIKKSGGNHPEAYHPESGDIFPSFIGIISKQMKNTDKEIHFFYG
jgi:hypothetical protein